MSLSRSTPHSSIGHPRARIHRHSHSPDGRVTNVHLRDAVRLVDHQRRHLPFRGRRRYNRKQLGERQRKVQEGVLSFTAIGAQRLYAESEAVGMYEYYRFGDLAN